MTIHTIRLGMAIFFLVMSIGLFTRRSFLSAEVLQHYSESRLDLAAAFALLLCGWNAVRWYAAKSNEWRKAHALESRQKSVEQNPTEYNPDLDFTKKD